jgi:hypothetical protein
MRSSPGSKLEKADPPCKHLLYRLISSWIANEREHDLTDEQNS